MLIAQITDMHVTDGGKDPAKDLVDANASLARAVEALNAQPVAPDLVIATGDLTDHGSPEEYRILRDLLEPLAAPVYLIPGNHDDSRLMAGALGNPSYLPGGGGHLSYVIDGYAIRVVALDTSDPERHDGVFSPDRAEWLDAALAAAPERPTLIAMHHPPFATGIWWMDAMGLDGAARFREVLAGHPQVRRVICGHVHRSVQATWGPTMLSVCPSTAYQTVATLEPSHPPQLAAEPPSFQMHWWTGEGFVCHTLPVRSEGPRLDLSQIMDWPKFRKRLAAGGPFFKSKKSS
ncbi:phosphodiesterase [Sorangium sp. So ce1128]